MTSSPGLRILRFGLEFVPDISFTLAERDSIVPVRLNDLQVLDLDLDRQTENSLQYILRWVSPGSNPLKLLLPRSYGTVLKTVLITRNRTEIHNFLMRSKVVELCLYTRTLMLDWLFSSAPHLQTLAVWFNSSPETLNDEDRKETDNSMLHSTINKLYILASTLRIDTLCQGLSRCPQIQALVFWRCAFVTEEGGTYAVDMFIKHPELLNICSEIENISDSPSPIGGWRAPPHGYTYSI